MAHATGAVFWIEPNKTARRKAINKRLALDIGGNGIAPTGLLWEIRKDPITCNATAHSFLLARAKKRRRLKIRE
jgi:hypothetical protein